MVPRGNMYIAGADASNLSLGEYARRRTLIPNSPSSARGNGNPALASKEKGLRYCREVTTRVAEFLVDLAAADVTDLYADAE